MSAAWWLTGDARTVIAELPRSSIDLVLTSPPYPWQRSYLDPGDPAKMLEVGQPLDPAAAVAEQLEWIDLCWDLLAPHGVLVVNLGDHTSGSSGGDGTADLHDGLARTAGRLRSEGSALKMRRYQNDRFKGGPIRDRAADEADGIAPVRKRWRDRGNPPPDGWPREQAVCWIPHLVGASLAYGRNLLTGEPCRQWVTRSARTWCKPSPTPGRLVRGFRPATELLLIVGKSESHWWDIDPTRRPAKDGEIRAGHLDHERRRIPGVAGHLINPRRDGGRVNAHPFGAPPLNWTVTNSATYPGAHLAVMPDDLCAEPIVAGCPERVCTCGEPWRRRVVCDSCGAVGHDEAAAMLRFCTCDPRADGAKRWRRTSEWWLECGHGHGEHRRGRVLDPFAGTGTVLSVATGYGRDAIGIDLDSRNAAMARARLGMMVTETTAAELAPVLDTPTGEQVPA